MLHYIKIFYCNYYKKRIIVSNYLEKIVFSYIAKKQALSITFVVPQNLILGLISFNTITKTYMILIKKI